MKYKISGILLAAGESKRFKTNKLLFKVKDNPIIYYSLKNLISSQIDKIFVVLGRDENLENYVKKEFEHKKIEILKNENPEKGIISSVKIGIKKCKSKFNAVLIHLADMPFVSTDVINKLIYELKKTKKIIVPKVKDKIFHPRIFPEKYFDEFLKLKDNESGKKVIEKYKKEVMEIEFEDENFFKDIDTMEDLRFFYVK